VRDYTKAIELRPTLGAALLNRGHVYYQTERYAEAKADFEAAIKTTTEPTLARFDAALACLALKDRAEAERHLRTLLLNHPDHKEARNLLTSLQAQSEAK